MRLASLNRLLSVLLVALAAFPLLLGGELPIPVWLVVAGALTSGVLWGDKVWPRAAIVAVTSSVVAFFIYLIISSLQSGDWLPNSFIFGLVATSARALQMPSSRQQFQMLGLSFLLLIASAVGNPDLSFALFFMAYTVVLTWALTSVHFMEKVELTMGEAAMRVPASKLLTRRFLVGSSALALTLLASSMVLFFLFPRMGLGFFSAQTRKGAAVSGFNDNVELGHFGTIRDSDKVVLRIEFPEGSPFSPESMHIRGMALDRYERGSWSRSQTKQRPMRTDSEGHFVIPDWVLSGNPEGPRFMMDVYAEPMDMSNTVVFTAGTALRIRPEASRFDKYRGMEKRFTVDAFGNLFVKRGRHDAVGSFSFSVEAVAPTIPEGARRGSNGVLPEWFTEMYLQLPSDLDSRVTELAGEWVEGLDGEYAKAERITSRLRSSFGYSLEGSGSVEDPISHFLFERKEGHCEYFASAGVIMMRSVGVPARLVNGFLGAGYNEFGEYYVVTENRAHSWVEVLLPGAGWVVFDPTPPAGMVPVSSGFWTEISNWFDSLRLMWYKWVVEFNLDMQLGLYIRIWNTLASQSDQVEIRSDSSMAEMREQWKKVRSSLLRWETLSKPAMLLAGLLLIGLVVRIWKRRRGRDDGRELHERLVRAATAKGIVVRPGETLAMVAGRLERAGYGGAGQFGELARQLEEYRWDPTANAGSTTLRRSIRRLKLTQPGSAAK